MTNTITQNEPAVYVGTYGKYNSGSIAGKWLTLSDYSDKDEFLEACAELHKGEHDPEFMFQDREHCPEALVSESHIDEKLWEWLELDEEKREIVSRLVGDNICSNFQEALCSLEDLVVHENWDAIVDQWIELENAPENLIPYLNREYIKHEQEICLSTFELENGNIVEYCN